MFCFFGSFSTYFCFFLSGPCTAVRCLKAYLNVVIWSVESARLFDLFLRFILLFAFVRAACSKYTTKSIKDRLAGRSAPGNTGR